MQTTETSTNALVDQLVIKGRTLPAHPAKQPNLPHAATLPKGNAWQAKLPGTVRPGHAPDTEGHPTRGGLNHLVRASLVPLLAGREGAHASRTGKPIPSKALVALARRWFGGIGCDLVPRAGRP